MINRLSRIRKIFKITMIITASFVLLISVVFQFSVESYRIKQMKQYGILKNKQRLSYEPALVYYIFDREPKLKRAFLLPYIETNINEFLAKGFYDEYIVKCFYNNTEIENYLNTKTNINNR
jgi:hypothetical protein